PHREVIDDDDLQNDDRQDRAAREPEIQSLVREVSMGRSHWRVPYPGVLLRGEGTHHQGDRRIAYAKARHGGNRPNGEKSGLQGGGKKPNAQNPNETKGEPDTKRGTKTEAAQTPQTYR